MLSRELLDCLCPLVHVPLWPVSLFAALSFSIYMFCRLKEYRVTFSLAPHLLYNVVYLTEPLLSLSFSNHMHLELKNIRTEQVDQASQNTKVQFRFLCDVTVYIQFLAESPSYFGKEYM
ncbi:hypothetical protein AMECASPLE_039549 [Ameca splendens]|uniref:Uncharacterized protein n=1 Tax=Ameca splendens TaxID=208324 RepID=A0ABV0Z7N0_9TELE